MLGMAFIATAHAQEIPRPSISRQKDAAPAFERPYNLKLGPVAFTMGAALGIEYVDNVNLTTSATKPEGDVILSPSISVTGVWQVTRLNSLELRTTFGYTKYLDHPELDSPTALVSPDSEIRLNLFIGDVKFVFREQFSLQDETVNQGGVGGVARLGRFVNTVGVTALWDLNDITWSLGFDRYDLITTGDSGNTAGSGRNYSTLDRNTHQLSTAMIFRLGPTTQLGLEGTAGISRYPNNPNADVTVYSIGPFIDMQLTRYTRLTLSGGYQIYRSDNQESANSNIQPSDTIITSQGFLISVPQTGTAGPRTNGDGDSYYFNLALSHRLNRFYQDRLSISHELQTGLLSDRSETTGVSYSSGWAISRRFSLSTSIFYQNVHQVSQFPGNANAGIPDYQRYGVAISTGYQLTRKLNVGISYQFTKETSDSGSRDYAQNRFGLRFGYQF